MSVSTIISLDATTRQETGKNVARRFRAAGLIPVTVYGGGQEPAKSTVAKRELAALIRRHGRSKIITLNLDGKPVTVKIAQLQLDPVRDTVIHADFMRLLMTEKASFTVPLKIVGEPEGVKNSGGVMDVVLHHLEIRCLPGDLPESIEVDVTSLGIGDHLNVGQIKANEKVEILNDAEVVVATVIAPRTGEEPTASEAPAEPEVIKKGKAEESEA